MPLHALNGMMYYVTETGDGPPLLLLHGFTGSSTDWTPLIQRLAPNCYCAAPDLLGHGKTDAPQDWHRYSIEHATADILTLLDQLSIPCASVIGYSMGGRLALHLACTAPERVHKLVLEGASPGLATEDERLARQQADDALAQFIVEAGVAAFVQRWEDLPLFATQRRLNPAQIETLRQMRMQNTPTGLSGSLRGMSTGRQPCLWPKLSSLHMPVLLLAGEKDAKFQALATQMHAQIPDATLRIVPNAGHNIHLEQPEAFFLAVSPFLWATKSILLQ